MTYESTVLSYNPTFFWKFNEPTGSDIIVDYGTGDNDLRLGGDYTPGKPEVVYGLGSSILTSGTALSASINGAHPNQDFTVEIWFRYFEQPDTTDALYSFVSGGSEQFGVRMNGDFNTSRIKVYVEGVSEEALISTFPMFDDEKPHQIVLQVLGTAGQVGVYLDGIFVETLSGWGNFNLGTNGYTSVFSDQTAEGVVVPEATLHAGSVVVYDETLASGDILALYQAGDIYPYVTFSPDSGYKLNVNDYVTATVKGGTQGEDEDDYNLGLVDVVADYDFTTLSVVSNGVWGDGWEGAWTDYGTDLVVQFRRSAGFSHPSAEVTYRVTASNDVPHVRAWSEDYNQCGFTAYPVDFKPHYEEIVDENGCPIDC